MYISEKVQILGKKINKHKQGVSSLTKTSLAVPKLNLASSVIVQLTTNDFMFHAIKRGLIRLCSLYSTAVCLRGLGGASDLTLVKSGAGAALLGTSY